MSEGCKLRVLQRRGLACSCVVFRPRVSRVSVEKKIGAMRGMCFYDVIRLLSRYQAASIHGFSTTGRRPPPSDIHRSPHHNFRCCRLHCSFSSGGSLSCETRSKAHKSQHSADNPCRRCNKLEWPESSLPVTPRPDRKLK